MHNQRRTSSNYVKNVLSLLSRESSILNAASIGPVLARYWPLLACLQRIVLIFFQIVVLRALVSAIQALYAIISPPGAYP